MGHWALEVSIRGVSRRRNGLCEIWAFIEQQRCPECTLKCELRQTFARSEDPVGVHALACCPELAFLSTTRAQLERHVF